MSHCEIEGFYGRVDEDSNVLGHDAVSIGKQLPALGGASVVFLETGA